MRQLKRAPFQLFLAMVALVLQQFGHAQTSYDLFESSKGTELRQLRSQLQSRLTAEVREPFFKNIKIMEGECDKDLLLKHLNQLVAVRNVALAIREESLRLDPTGAHGVGHEALDFAQRIDRLDSEIRPILAYSSSTSVSNISRRGVRDLIDLEATGGFGVTCLNGYSDTLGVGNTKISNIPYCSRSASNRFECFATPSLAATHMCQ